MFSHKKFKLDCLKSKLQEFLRKMSTFRFFKTKMRRISSEHFPIEKIRIYIYIYFCPTFLSPFKTFKEMIIPINTIQL